MHFAQEAIALITAGAAVLIIGGLVHEAVEQEKRMAASRNPRDDAARPARGDVGERQGDLPGLAAQVLTDNTPDEPGSGTADRRVVPTSPGDEEMEKTRRRERRRADRSEEERRAKREEKKRRRAMQTDSTVVAETSDG